VKQIANKRERDKRIIEALVWRLGALSRAEIHQMTHLHRSDISRMVRELLNEKKLRESGRGDNRTGRKQVLLRLREKHAYVLSLAFDDQAVSAATLDLSPKVLSAVSEPTRLDCGIEGLMTQLVQCGKKALGQAGVSAHSLLGVGVASSGLINTRTGELVMSSTIDFCKRVPVGQILSRELGVATMVHNLARAKAVAERALGAGAMAADMIYVEYGRTGIGAGVIVDGQLLYGSGHSAGEFGHTHVTEDGPACRCGSFGCLEAVAGGRAIEGRIRKALAEGCNSLVMELAGHDAAKITGLTVLKAAGMGDKTCLAIVEQMATHLGLGLANLVNLFNPKVLVLDQRLDLAGNALLDQVVKVIRRQALRQSVQEVAIRFGQLGEEASVLGMATLVLEKHFEIPPLKPPRFMVESVSVPVRRNSTAQASDPEGLFVNQTTSVAPLWALANGASIKFSS
jgi:predicted NBD/HSP70 family sugar kinase